MSIKFRTLFEAIDKHNDFISPSGDGFVDVYELKDNDDLVKTGKKNLYEEIQAYRESTDIRNIINRFVNGEANVLNQVHGFYGDVTSAPTSYADYFAKVKEAEKIFNQLPEDIRYKFDDDPEKFFLEFGTSSFAEKVNEVENKEEIIEKSEVIDNAE